MKTKTVLLAALVMTLMLPSVAFAGAPTLKNRDSSTYHFRVKCGSSTRINASIGGSATRTLEDGDGCKLEVDGVGDHDLEDGMECVISGGSLDCD